MNCCTIDWFSEWPKAALQSVATHFFNNMNELVTTDEVIEAMVVSVHLCVWIQKRSIIREGDLAMLIASLITPSSKVSWDLRRLWGVTSGC